METPQAHFVIEEPEWPKPHNAPEYPCVVCGKKTTFRYESLPICQSCAREKRL